MSFRTLVDAETLTQHLADPGWVVCDVRHQLADVDFGERAYRAGHLPGAHFLHCDRDLSGPTTGQNGRHPLPQARILAARLGGLGIGPQTQVVVYDDSQGMIAGRLWWLLRWLGHELVAVLDGGIQAWQAVGGRLSEAIPQAISTEFPIAPGVPALSLADMQTHIDRPELCLVDARSPDRYRGENETIDPVGGCLPGARNRFFRDNLAADGRFKPADTLRAEWLALLAGQAPASTIHYCGSGVSACHNLLAMEIAGLSEASLYAGSWSEWCANT